MKRKETVVNRSIEVSADVAFDPRVRQVADGCRISMPQAIGHFVMLFGRGGGFAEKDPKGEVFIHGLLKFSPLVVEFWAQWTGEPGLFDGEVRKAFGVAEWADDSESTEP